MKDKNIGIGIIGAGAFGKKHARAILETPGTRLIAASRRNSTQLQKFSHNFNIIGYTDYRELLKNPEVNAVVVALPHQEHAGVSINAAKAGKHILLEKPMATNIPDCLRIIDSVESTGVKLMLGHTLQFMRSSIMAKEIIDSGELGELVYGTGIVSKKWMNPDRREWHMNDPVGGGMLMTVGIHFIDLLCYFFGSPVVSVRANLSTRFHEQEADDAGQIFMQFDSGATGMVVNTGYVTGAESCMATLTCTRGILRCGMHEGVLIGRDDRWTHVPESVSRDSEHEGLANEWKAFIGAIRSDAEPTVSGIYGKYIMDIVFAARESSLQKKEVWI